MVGDMRRMLAWACALMTTCACLAALTRVAPAEGAGAAPVWQLPFENGQRWQAGSPHSTDFSALDFGPTSGNTNRRVVAAAAGTVYRIDCSGGSYLGIDHGSGWSSTYYHLVNQQMQLVGKAVQAGTYLGDAGQALPCGGSSTFNHVHLTVRKDGQPTPVSGFRFGNYVAHSSGSNYRGWWTDAASGATVVTNNGAAACCLTSTTSPATPPKLGAASPRESQRLAASYAYQFTASGTPAPTFSVATGALPAGLTLSSSGLLQGRPERLGTFAFQVRATNAAGSATTSNLTVVVRESDGNGDGLPDSLDQAGRTDVNGDGRPDIVGFSDTGVVVAPGTGSGFGAPQQWTGDFGLAGGWRVDRHVRMLADVTGDRRPDVIGFASDGVQVARNTGAGFAAPASWNGGFGYSEGWRVQNHPRMVVDVNGDGRPDLVGFGDSGMLVALNSGASFAPATTWSGTFGYRAGWRVESHPRQLVDVSGDGLPDVVGFAAGGVVVAVNTGTSFAPPTVWSGAFGYDAGWRVENHPRMVRDVNGDGRPDLVAFAGPGVLVALNTGTAFAEPTSWNAGFGHDQGWRTEKHPRMLVDVNADGRPDLVGFGADGVLVALNTGAAFATASTWSGTFAYNVNGWRVENHPRMLADVTGDGRPDVIGFANAGVAVAANTGSGFAAPVRWADAFGYDAGGWRVEQHLRLLAGVSDADAPTVDVADPDRWLLRSSLTLGWSGSDAGSGVQSYDVRFRAAKFNADFGAWVRPTEWQAITTTSVTDTDMARGYTYCYAVRARDKAGNVSGWSGDRCTTVALDDRSLAGSGWTDKAHSESYAGTYKTTTTSGRYLSIANGQAARVAVVATTCAGCGEVGVYVAGSLVGKVNLYSATTKRAQVLALPAFALKSGTVTVKVLSSGKTIQIDGLAITRV